MGLIGKDFTYKKIKNFLTKDEVKLLSNYCEIRHRNNTTDFDESKEIKSRQFFSSRNSLVQ